MGSARTPTTAFAVSLGAIMLIAPMAVHLFLPAMPDVKARFQASNALVQLTFSVTLIVMAVVTPAYGTLSDRYGRRPVLLSGLTLFLTGSLAAALAPSLPVLIAGRIVQAMGAGCGATLTRAIARDAYGAEALVKAIAYLTIAYTLGPMIAPPLGGMLIDAFGWRTVFWFALVTGSAIMLAAWTILYETRGPAERAGERHSLFSLYFDLLRNRSFVAFVLQSGFMSFSFFAIASASPFLMSAALGRSATEFGLYFMLFPLGFCAGNIISSRLSGKVNIETMVVIGAFICFVSTAVQTVVIAAGHLSPLTIFIPGGVMSFAQGLCLPNAQAGAIRVRPALAGTAAGLGVFIQMSLSALSTQIYGMTADGTATPMIAIAMTGAALAMLAAIAVFYAPRPKGAL